MLQAYNVNIWCNLTNTLAYFGICFLSQEEEKSEVLQLHEKMKRENEMRKRESAELRSLIESQKQLLDLAGRDLVSML
jgi:hypothetical protein